MGQKTVMSLYESEGRGHLAGSFDFTELCGRHEGQGDGKMGVLLIVLDLLQLCPCSLSSAPPKFISLSLALVALVTCGEETNPVFRLSTSGLWPDRPTDRRGSLSIIVGFFLPMYLFSVEK